MSSAASTQGKKKKKTEFDLFSQTVAPLLNTQSLTKPYLTKVPDSPEQGGLARAEDHVPRIY